MFHRTGLADNPAYVASKHAVNGLTRNAAVDYAPHGIRVNSMNMSATDTPMIARAKTQGLLAYANTKHRPATIAEQVSMMLFLLSKKASNFTGGIFPTDGGWTDY